MADREPSHRGRKPEIVRSDDGGWISGPSLAEGADAVQAADLMPGDVLLHDDIEAEVTAPPRPGHYRIGDEDQITLGVAIDWQAGTRSGVIFRRPGDLLLRLSAAGRPEWVKVCQHPGCVITADHKHGAS
jgi:hypothetical protein